MSQNAASGVGLHCLVVSHKKDARLIWFNERLKITVIIVHISLNRLLYMTSIIASSQRYCVGKDPMTKLSCDYRNLIARNWPRNSECYNG